jgi:hypothetical protein
MDGKTKLEALVERLRDHDYLDHQFVQVRARDIRSISDAFKAIEEEKERLQEFAVWAIREGPFEGCDLAGDAIEEKGVALGLLEATAYDPEKHGPSDCAEPGMPWFIFTSILKGSRHEG